MKRFYRQWVKAKDLIKTRISVEQTDLQILCDKPLDRAWLKQAILHYRQDIKNYIARDKTFLTSLKPISVELNAPVIIKQMAQAARIANVGPMAAVAGAIAQQLTKDLLKTGCRQVIIENGGDVYLSKQKKNRLIGVFAGKSKFSGRISLLVKSIKTPCGVCASSATFGHSLSFGNADSAIVLAKDGAIADATATATCNLIKSKNDLNRAIRFARNIPGVFGIVAIIDDNLASWGGIKINF